MVWGHGSEQAQPHRMTLARFYTEMGLAFFTPHRRGHGESPGENPAAQMRAELHRQIAATGHTVAASDADAPAGAQATRHELMQRVIEIHEGYLQDTIAAVNWLLEQPFVDPQRVYMSGASHGGVQTLLAAEADTGAQAYVAFAPGAIGWRGNPELHERLARACRRAPTPLMIIQAENDFDLGPTRLLGEELRRKGSPNAACLYPAYGRSHDDGHGRFACEGVDVWGVAVGKFLGLATSSRLGSSSHPAHRP